MQQFLQLGNKKGKHKKNPDNAELGSSAMLQVPWDSAGKAMAYFQFTFTHLQI